LLSSGTALQAIVECATALERAEASARVLAARAAGHGGSPRAFAELAAIAPEGLIPTPGRGAAHVARQVARAADVAVAARELLGGEIVDAVEWAAGMAQRVASTSDALDPAGASRTARRGVAAVRGLVASTLDRDARWEAFRLGTHLPRASWVTALADATARVARTSGSDESWAIAACITGLAPDARDVPRRLLSDRSSVVTAAHSLAEAEAALVALQREGHVGSVALPLAREAQARLRSAAAEDGNEQIGAAVERVLEGLAALAGAIDPRVAEPGAPPYPGLRRPALTASPSVLIQ
jgi:uncharacterized alpha-E superfamily protein